MRGLIPFDTSFIPSYLYKYFGQFLTFDTSHKVFRLEGVCSRTSERDGCQRTALATEVHRKFKNLIFIGKHHCRSRHIIRTCPCLGANIHFCNQCRNRHFDIQRFTNYEVIQIQPQVQISPQSVLAVQHSIVVFGLVIGNIVPPQVYKMPPLSSRHPLP